MVRTYGELYRHVKYILREEEGDQAARTARDRLAALYQDVFLCSTV